MTQITVGVLTISDRCANKTTTDESGPLLVEMVRNGVIQNGVIQVTKIIPDVKEDITEVLKKWCEDEINVILTTGGTGIAATDVTPEATIPLLDKTIPGITQLILQKSLSITPLAALSRAVAGVRKKSLILNFPGSKKACRECLEVVSIVIPHAVALIVGAQNDVEKDHSNLNKKKVKVSVNSSALNRKSLYDTVDVEEAQNILQKKINLLCEIETIDFDKALGYVLAEDVISNDFLPSVDVSISDGYAIFNDYPNRKNVLSTWTPDAKINYDSTCVKVNTGGPIPLGTIKVVRVEETKVFEFDPDGKEKIIDILKLPPTESDIRRKGSEYVKGEVLLVAKTKLDSAALGILASAGITSVRVYKKPVVAVISTGDEIVDPRAKPSPGKFRDSNRIVLLNLLKEEGFIGRDAGWAPDDPESLYDILAKGFRNADIVVTTGSMSMGEKDFLKDILKVEFGAEILFGRVMMKPGLPTAFAILEFEGKHKVWFGFPGNPASATVASHLFLLPSLRIIVRDKKQFSTSVQAVLKTHIERENRPHYVRGVLSLDDNKFTVSSTGNQMSSRIASCVSSNCLILIPPGETAEVGSTVKVLITGKI